MDFTLLLVLYHCDDCYDHDDLESCQDHEDDEDDDDDHVAGCGGVFLLC